MILPNPVITLTTDFGLTDPYVGVMKGVIFGINPEARIVDLSHSIEPHGITQAAFLLANSFPHFPSGTIHLIVVDPGVGSNRMAILVEMDGHYFVAPDNGVLSYVLNHSSGPNGDLASNSEPITRDYRSYSINNSNFWLDEPSHTFHGRDIFAPVAAHLSKGVDLKEFGEPLESVQVLPMRIGKWSDDFFSGRIIHIDHFGNLITDIPHEIVMAASKLKIEVSGQFIDGLSNFYSQTDGLLAIIGSYNTLEIAINGGNAAEELSVKIGDVVSLERV